MAYQAEATVCRMRHLAAPQETTIRRRTICHNTHSQQTVGKVSMNVRKQKNNYLFERGSNFTEQICGLNGI